VPGLQSGGAGRWCVYAPAATHDTTEWHMPCSQCSRYVTFTGLQGYTMSCWRDTLWRCQYRDDTVGWSNK
jgi:hypothetical protein